MTILRMLIIAFVIALGTVLAGWWMVPVVGIAYGLVARGTRRPALLAAAGGALAWGGYLAIAAIGDAPVTSFGAALASAVQLPVWAPIVATLIFPALLAGLASYVGARLGARYLSTP